MTDTIVTADSVELACAELEAQDITPSAPRVRKLLGDRGSFETIQRYLHNRSPKTKAAPNDTVPIPTVVEALCGSLWEQARASAAEALAAERAELAQRTEQFTELEIELTKKIDTAEAINEHLRGDIAKLEAQTTEARNQLTQAARSISELQERLAEHKALNATLEKELSAAKESATKALEEKSQAEERATRAILENATLAEKNRALEERIAEQNTRFERLESTLAALNDGKAKK